MNIVIDDRVIIGYQTALVDFKTTLVEVLAEYGALKAQADRDRLMTIQEACEYLRCNEDTLLYYRSRGLEYFKKGREAVWYKKGDIDDWLASGKVSRHQKPKVAIKKIRVIHLESHQDTEDTEKSMLKLE